MGKNHEDNRAFARKNLNSSGMSSCGTSSAFPYHSNPYGFFNILSRIGSVINEKRYTGIFF